MYIVSTFAMTRLRPVTVRATDSCRATDVGRLVPPLRERDDAASEVSEWELRERQERHEEREAEAEALGAADEVGAGEERPLFLPTPPFMVSAGED